jgi:hypothetical protein
VATIAGFVAGLGVTGLGGGLLAPRVWPWPEKLSDFGLPKQLPILRKGVLWE